jgi:hypothetical protein
MVAIVNRNCVPIKMHLVLRVVGSNGSVRPMMPALRAQCSTALCSAFLLSVVSHLRLVCSSGSASSIGLQCFVHIRDCGELATIVSGRVSSCHKQQQ